MSPSYYCMFSFWLLSSCTHHVEQHGDILQSERCVQRNIFGCGIMGCHRSICLFLATPFAIQIHFHPLATNGLLPSPPSLAGLLIFTHSLCVLDLILHKTKKKQRGLGPYQHSKQPGERRNSETDTLWTEQERQLHVRPNQLYNYTGMMMVMMLEACVSQSRRGRFSHQPDRLGWANIN